MWLRNFFANYRYCGTVTAMVFVIGSKSSVFFGVFFLCVFFVFVLKLSKTLIELVICCHAENTVTLKTARLFGVFCSINATPIPLPCVMNSTIIRSRVCLTEE